MTEPNDRRPPFNYRHTFGLRHLLIGVALVAAPMALFSRYWMNVYATVDERTIPFRDTGFLNQLLLYASAASMVLIAVGVITWLLWRRSYVVIVMALILSLSCFPFLATFTKSRIFEPEQGNRVAEVHNNAATEQTKVSGVFDLRSRLC